jgi:nucleotide-binding universal stress UspA family protein
MFKKMLVVLDGSKNAEVVFNYAQEMAARKNLTLELLHVCTPQEKDQLSMRKAYIEHMAEIIQQKEELIRDQSGIKSSGQTKGVVVVGYPAEEILKYIEENNIDLLMLSSHGNTGNKIWSLGSVANKVIHAVKIPVFIVPSQIREDVIYDKSARRSVTIPINGDKATEAVIPYAVSNAKQRGAESEIVLIYVDNVTDIVLSSTELQQFEEHRSSIQKYLDGLVKQIKEAGVEARAEILSGNPASAIIQYINEHPTQLLVMATRSHSGLSHMIFGSVTESILQMLKNTPILLVKPLV